MKQLFETFMGMFFLFFLIVCSMACLSAAVDARNADKYKTEYIAQMENSDFAQGVVEKVFADAEEHGYKISLRFYKDLGGAMSTSPEVKNASQFRSQIGDTTGTYMVKLTLTFDYSFGLMKSFTSHTLLGYAK